MLAVFFSPPNINIKDGAFKKVYGRKEPNFWQSSAENFAQNWPLSDDPCLRNITI